MSAELVQLHSFYRDPGLVLLASSDGQALGCVALRVVAPAVGEVRRLFVSPTRRSAGLGRRLMDDLVARAKARGFERLVLNTLPTMRHASRLYDEFGFEAIEPYVAEPTDGVLFYGRAV